MSKLILASASPRRFELLSQLGLPFTVVPADIDEQHQAGENPHDYAMRMSRTKAQLVAQQYPDAWVLGADTIVTIDQRILGKPRDPADAEAMLLSLSGRVHTVLTSLALVQHSRGEMTVEAIRTRVHFRPLPAAEIAAYIATEEPFDKAGAYAIQGRAGAFVDTFEGCYTNVVGLPVKRTADLLEAAGFSPNRS